MNEDLPAGYISGLDRKYPYVRVAHLYKGTFDDPGLPMCRYGWNRGGEYSIWRGHAGRQGICKICLHRARRGLNGVPLHEQEALET